MEIALTLLIWILVGDRIGHSVTGRMCTFKVSNSEVQLNCDSITCHFNECSIPNFIEFGPTCHFSNCTEGQLSLCQYQELPIINPSTCTIPRTHLECLWRNSSIQREISKTLCPSSSDMCNSYTTDSDIPITASAYTTPSKTNKTGQLGESLIVTSLGALVGILLVLLVMVTTGWVWTCWTMKRKERNKTNSEQVRTIQNTAYGVILPVNNSSTGRTISSNIEQLDNTSQAGGNDLEEEGGEEHEYHVLEGPSGDEHIHQNKELEMREVIESGEEHEYHVLEGPGGDDASREPRQREVGGAMDYEIPLPLKK